MGSQGCIDPGNEIVCYLFVVQFIQEFVSGAFIIASTDGFNAGVLIMLADLFGGCAPQVCGIIAT